MFEDVIEPRPKRACDFAVSGDPCNQLRDFSQRSRVFVMNNQRTQGMVYSLSPQFPVMTGTARVYSELRGLFQQNPTGTVFLCMALICSYF